MCSLIRESLQNFAKDIINLEYEKFFDSPSAVRTIKGLIMTFNEMAINHSERSIVKLDL